MKLLLLFSLLVFSGVNYAQAPGANESFLKAVNEADSEKVEKYIDQVSSEVKNKALWNIVDKKEPEYVKIANFLLGNAADPNYVDPTLDMRILVKAVKDGSADMLKTILKSPKLKLNITYGQKTLIELTADKEKNSLLIVYGYDPRIAETVAMTINDATFIGYIKGEQFEEAKEVQNVSHKAKNKALWDIVAKKGKGYLDFAKFLIELKDGPSVNLREVNNVTLLMRAAAVGTPEMLNLLLEKVNNITYLEQKDKSGKTVLDWAETKEKKDLIERKIIDLKNPQEAFQRGIRGGHIGLVEKTIDRIISEKTKSDALLYVAAQPDPKFVDIAEILIDKGAEINAQDQNGNTPLILATLNGSLSMLEYLLSVRGGNPNLTNQSRMNPLDYAYESFSKERYLIKRKKLFLEKMEALRSAGANPSKIALEKIEKILKGDLPQDFAPLLKNLNDLQKSLEQLINQLQKVA
ncbi:MAG: ankyrin repeat domain-containing protein [Candidatus Babeliales bacterium]